MLCNTLSIHSKLSQRKIANKRQLTQWPFWFKAHRYPSVRYQALSGISWCFSDSVGCCSCYLLQSHLDTLSHLWWVLLYLQRNVSSSVLVFSWTLKALTKITDCFRMMCYSVFLSSVIQRKVLIWRYLDPVYWLLIQELCFQNQAGSGSESASTKVQVDFGSNRTWGNTGQTFALY